MPLVGVAKLLQSVLLLLTFVQSHPELPQSARDNAQQIAQTAVAAAAVEVQKQMPPSCTLTPNPATIPARASSVLSLFAQNADTASLDFDIGPIATSGIATIMNIATTTTFTATVVNQNGAAKCSAKVQVI